MVFEILQAIAKILRPVVYNTGLRACRTTIVGYGLLIAVICAVIE